MPLKEVFEDIAAVDNNSMTFRYSHDLDDNKHLPDLEHINLGVLGERLRGIFKQAEEFSLLLDILEDEYAQNTFTSKLHRGQIESIAKRLPLHKKWNDELSPIKQEICDELHISSNDFSKAVKLIQKHREFANMVGLEMPLEGLPVDVFSRLERVHSGNAKHSLLSRDEWLSLEAVLEISNLYRYSEEYDSYLQHISAPNSEIPYDPAHILRNAYARNQRLRTGLLKLGQPSLLTALADAIPDLAKPLTPRKGAKKELEKKLKNAFKHMSNANLGKAPQKKGGKGSKEGQKGKGRKSAN